MGRRIREIVIGISISLCAFLVIEISLRVAGFTYKSEDGYVFAENIIQQLMRYPRFRVFDPQLFYRYRPRIDILADFIDKTKGFYHINSLGLRGGECEPVKPPGNYRVICVGNSCTFGWGLPDNETYPSLLKESLSALLPQKKVEVINAGLPAYSSWQMLTLVKERLLDLGPDLIVLYAGANDASQESFQGDKQRNPQLEYLLGLLYFHLKKLKIYQLMQYLLDLLHISGAGGHYFSSRLALRVSPAEFRENLLELIRITKARNIGLVILTMPARPRLPGADLELKRLKRIVAKTGIAGILCSYGVLPGYEKTFTCEPQVIKYYNRPVLYLPSQEQVFFLSSQWLDYATRFWERWYEATAAYNRLLRQDPLLKKYVLDIEALFRGREKDLLYDYCHPNKEGNRLIATVLSK